MNTYMATGNLTRDPELREFDGRSECKLRIAVDNGPYPTTFIDVRTFDAQADACATYLRKGRRVGVTGKLALDEWTATDGSPRQRYSVIGRVELLSRPRRDGEVGGDRVGPVEPSSPADGVGATEEVTMTNAKHTEPKTRRERLAVIAARYSEEIHDPETLARLRGESEIGRFAGVTSEGSPESGFSTNGNLLFVGSAAELAGLLQIGAPTLRPVPRRRRTDPAASR